MRSRPNAVELLDIAEKTLSGEVAPDLSSRQRYNVALITSALGIAQRELNGGLSAWPEELSALEAIYGSDGGAEPAEELDRLNRRFAQDLRAGRFDENGQDRKTALTLLREDVLARLAEDNPRYQK
jgi:hypothetical protein